MNCHEIESILNDHETRTLSAAQRSAVDLHLAKCERCADAWSIHETLANETPARPRQKLFAETVALLGTDASRPQTPFRRFGPALGIAATLLVIAFLAFNVFLDEIRSNEAVAVSDQNATAPRNAPESTTTAASVPAVTAAADAQATDVPEMRFVAGRDYARLPTAYPTTSGPDRVEVSEFFMFGCHYCYAFEPYLEAWSAGKPDSVDLLRVPAIFNALARLHAQAFYTAEALHKSDDLRMPFFEEIHLNGNPLDTEAALAAFFGRFGVDEQTFEDTFNSFAVYAKLRRAEELNRQYRIAGTPSIVVNGKFLTTGAMAGSYENWFAIIDELVEREVNDHCGRASSKCRIQPRPAF